MRPKLLAALSAIGLTATLALTGCGYGGQGSVEVAQFDGSDCTLVLSPKWHKETTTVRITGDATFCTAAATATEYRAEASGPSGSGKLTITHPFTWEVTEIGPDKGSRRRCAMTWVHQDRPDKVQHTTGPCRFHRLHQTYSDTERLTKTVTANDWVAV
jgi:hypothetical protein